MRAEVASGLVLLLVLVACDRPFEGSIRYEVSVQGEAAPSLEPFLSGQELGFTLYQRGDKVRIERSTEVVLVDYAQDSFFVISPRDSSYWAFALSSGQDSLPGLTVSDLSQKRIIAGYECKGKRVEYVADGRRYSTTYWEALALKPSAPCREQMPILPRGVKVEGFPLRLEIAMSELPFTLIHEAVEVQAKKLNDELFAVPLSFRRATKSL
ncbi:MAG: hypothetical protein NZ989_07035 [Bacteroidia bacterium]|nr:hypothetical protein [Bacteroidia bacterium]